MGYLSSREEEGEASNLHSAFDDRKVATITLRGYWKLTIMLVQKRCDESVADSCFHLSPPSEKVVSIQLN